MNICKINNTNFNGHLAVKTKEYIKNKNNELTLRPVCKFINTDDITSISKKDNNIIIEYKNKKGKQETFLKYEPMYKSDLGFYNLVLNAYNAAKNSKISIYIPNC